MKKIAIALAGVMLAGSLVAFTACGNDDDPKNLGVINGSFQEENDPQKSVDTVSKFDFSKAFGDTSSEDWALGLKLTEKLNANIDLTVKEAVQEYAAASANTQTAKGTAEISTNALLNVSKATAPEEGVVVLGKAEVSAKSKEDGAEEETASAAAYVDGDYVYASVSGLSNTPLKVKLSIADIIDTVSGIGGLSALADDTADDATNLPASGVSDLVDIRQGIAIFYQLGGKLSFDQNDGFKIKATLGDTFFSSVLLMASMSENTQAQTILSGISFRQNSSIVATVAFDKDGLFTEFGVSVDVGLNLDITKLGVVGGTISLSGGMKVERTTEKVTLPAGLAADTSYAEVSLSDLIGGSSSTPADPFEHLGETTTLTAGTYHFYAMKMDSETIIVGQEGINEDTITLTVNDDGTFTMMTQFGGESVSGVWVAADVGYTFTAEDEPITVMCYTNGIVLSEDGAAILLKK